MADGDATLVARKSCVVLMGRESLQNRLLASLIDERVGCSCLIRPFGNLAGLADTSRALMVLDAEDGAPGVVGSCLQVLSASESCRSIAVINADEDRALEQFVGWPKVKGVFCHQTSEEQLIKGIRAILDDECWLPRKMLSAYLEKTRIVRPPRLHNGSSLTRKEVETLRLLAAGNSNSHIALKLNVSPHTVKTHIYNLFRKIHVSNRVQAVSWALHNVDDIEAELRS